MSNTNDEIDFKLNIDKNLKEDTKIKVGDNEYTYGDIKKLTNWTKQEPIKCLVYWDDICQFTSLGLAEVVNSLYKSNAKIDIEHFLSRPNEYSYGIKYVYKLFEKVIKKEEINAIKKNLYWEIMEISLKSSLFMGLARMDSYFTKLGFYFPFHFKRDSELKEEFKKLFFKSTTNENLDFFFASDGVGLNDVMKNGGFNVIITPNAVQAYDYIIKNDLKRITIIAPDMHNGIDEELYNMFYTYRKFPKPNYCDISLYHEQIAVTNNVTADIN